MESVLKNHGEAEDWRRNGWRKKIDVSIQYISDLERGVVGASTSTLINICRILDASADYILFGKDPNTISDVSDRLKEYTPKQVESMYRIMDIIDDFYRTDDEWKKHCPKRQCLFRCKRENILRKKKNVGK